MVPFCRPYRHFVALAGFAILSVLAAVPIRPFYHFRAITGFTHLPFSAPISLIVFPFPISILTPLNILPFYLFYRLAIYPVLPFPLYRPCWLNDFANFNISAFSLPYHFSALTGFAFPFYHFAMLPFCNFTTPPHPRPYHLPSRTAYRFYRSAIFTILAPLPVSRCPFCHFSPLPFYRFAVLALLPALPFYH